MASALSHAISAAAVGSVFPRDRIPRKAWILGAACAVLPDADVLGFRMGVPYGSLWGHRGMTHSLFAALVLATVVSVVAARLSRGRIRALVLGTYLFVCTALHGVLDAMTNGGLGVAFLAPFSGRRFFFPFRPIEVSPLSVRAFFSEWGVSVLESEAIWIGIPCALLFTLGFVLEARRARRRSSSTPAA